MDDFDDLDPIPPLTRPEDTPPLRTQADLHRYWRALMGPLGFGFRRLWLIFLDHDDRVTPLVTQIDDIPEDPDPTTVTNLLWICQQVLKQHGCGRVAMLLSRPGGGGLRPSDRAWGREIHSAAERTNVPCAPLHLANDSAVRVIAGDDCLI